MRTAHVMRMPSSELNIEAGLRWVALKRRVIRPAPLPVDLIRQSEENRLGIRLGGIAGCQQESGRDYEVSERLSCFHPTAAANYFACPSIHLPLFPRVISRLRVLPWSRKVTPCARTLLF